MIIHDIFNEYQEKKEQIEISISKMKEDLGDMINKIILYGAGSAGIAFLHYLRDAGIEPVCFADGNAVRWGTVCEGLPIIDFREIPEFAGKDTLVIVTINTDGKKYCKSFDEALRAGGHQGVHKSLHDVGCKHVIDYTYFRRCRKLFHGDIYNLPSCSDVFLMEQKENELCEVYDMLADEESRDVFAKLVRFRMIDDSIQIPTMPQDKQYFEYDFYAKRPDEIFVDCGAYNGISLKTFLKENSNQFKKYYALEPDPENFVKLKNYIDSLSVEMKSKMILEEKAAYDEEKQVQFYMLGGPGSFISEIGNQIIETIKIDNLVEENSVTFIKMNIEGSELQALRGAKKTIKKSHPKLAVAGYHKTWDLWEVPKLIQQIDSTYKFYLRSYMNDLSFVYYGV